jgi:hypothetical protein
MVGGGVFVDGVGVFVDGGPVSVALGTRVACDRGRRTMLAVVEHVAGDWIDGTIIPAEICTPNRRTGCRDPSWSLGVGLPFR